MLRGRRRRSEPTLALTRSVRYPSSLGSHTAPPGNALGPVIASTARASSTSTGPRSSGGISEPPWRGHHRRSPPPAVALVSSTWPARCDFSSSWRPMGLAMISQSLPSVVPLGLLVCEFGAWGWRTHLRVAFGQLELVRADAGGCRCGTSQQRVSAEPGRCGCAQRCLTPPLAHRRWGQTARRERWSRVRRFPTPAPKVRIPTIRPRLFRALPSPCFKYRPIAPTCYESARNISEIERRRLRWLTLWPGRGRPTVKRDVQLSGASKPAAVGGFRPARASGGPSSPDRDGYRTSHDR